MILTRDFVMSYSPKIKDRSFGKTSDSILQESTHYFASTGFYDVFLSHSYADKEYVKKLISMFADAGYHTYVDWIDDAHLNREDVTPQTADLLRKRIAQSKGLAYVTSSNITNSKWCPWELGFADGKRYGKCCILPVLARQQESFSGQEYLGLYPYLEYVATDDFYVRSNGYRTKLSNWLNN